jgi:hypothetical protein
MDLIVTVPLLLGITLYASCLKIAARLVGSAVLSWRRAVGFAALVSVVVMVGLKEVFSRDWTTPRWIPFVIGAAIHLGPGTWFFSRAALAPNGELLGWRRALGVVAVTLALLLVAAVVLRALAFAFLDSLHLN